MMNDLDICKRIAEIESINMYQTKNAVYNNDDLRKDGQCRVPAIYNPLTDDALWNQLIIKHEVSISFIFCTLTIVLNGVKEKSFKDVPSLKRNALLLIIEAHNDT